MSADLDAGPARRALPVVAEQLAAATAARKCHSCGCLHQTVTALAVLVIA